MRPRVFPADDREVRQVEDDRLVTSMRPRVFPADDLIESGKATDDQILQ